MGAGNSIENITTNINKSVTESITNVFQNNANFTSTDQEIMLNCSQPTGNKWPQSPAPNVPINTSSTFYDQCFRTVTDTDLIKTNADLVKLASVCLEKDTNIPFLTCSATDLNLSNFINVQAVQDSSSEIINSISNTASNSVQQSVDAILPGTSTDNKVLDAVKTVQSILTSTRVTNMIYNSLVTNSTQRINITGAGSVLNTVTLNDTINTISQQLNSDKEYTDAVNNLSTVVSQKASAEFGGGTIGAIIASIVGFFLIIGLIIFLVKKFNKK